MVDHQEGNEEVRLTGVPLSPGLRRAKVHIIGGRLEAPDVYSIGEEDLAHELVRFEQALRATREQIKEMQARLAGSIGSKDASVFDAHLLVLEDSTVTDQVVVHLKEKRQNIEAAVYAVLGGYIESMRKIDDPYLRERVIDVEDVARRVIRNLEGTEHHHGPEAVDGETYILITHELTPSDTAAMDHDVVVGFATEVGGQTSHAAIMARSLGVPAVTGLHDVCDLLENGQHILLDGYNGLVIADPSPETLAFYEELEAEKRALTEELGKLRETESATADGQRIKLSGNIEFVYELDQVHQSGARGIGLYRTEFFYLNKAEFPSEEEQSAAYRKVAEAVAPDGAILRTLDVGGDKLYPELHSENEQNPFLGWRGIRVSLELRDLFKTQLRAALRASGFARVGLMYPMVSSLQEVRDANAVLEECREELRQEGVSFDEEMEVGAMIEVPSAAMMAEILADEVDFFSIGTNDLVQYTIAVDRVNEHVADLYQPTHPGVIRLMKRTVDGGHARGIWTGICGEMAGDIVLTPLLVGLNLDEFSVGAGQLPSVKYAIQRLNRSECQRLADEVLQMGDAREIRDRCRVMAEARYPELLR